MIRANLLPRPNERIAVFGMSLDLDALRQAASGLAFIIVVSGLTFGVQRMRIARIEDALARTGLAVGASAAQRSAVRELSLDVARYQEIEREALADRRSGGAVAVEIATIGNQVPANVWLDSIEHDAAGYAIAGASQRMAGVGAAMLAFARRSPSTSGELVSIDGRNPIDGGFRFEAHLTFRARTP